MRDYETMFILRPDLEEEAVEAVTTRFQGLITDGGGTVASVNKWGKRRLAYEIRGYGEGVYVIMEFSAEADVARELVEGKKQIRGIKSEYTEIECSG
jgi:small subunit ribosomal protein S6